MSRFRRTGTLDCALRPPRRGPRRGMDRTVPRLETHPSPRRVVHPPRRDRRVHTVEGDRRLLPPVRRAQPLVLRRPRLGPEPWLELTWPEPVELTEVVVILDADVQEDLINLHHRTPFESLPTLLSDYTLESRNGPDAPWQLVATVTANHHRTQRHRLDTPTRATHLRLTAHTTNGAPRAHVVSIRAYGQ
jgi:hypothetical protein